MDTTTQSSSVADWSAPAWPWPCIVPGWIFYIALGHLTSAEFAASLPVGWIAIFYSIMGIARLTYFTLDKNPIPGFFKGLPSPAAALLVLAPLVILDQSADASAQWIGFWSYFAVGTMLFGAVIMNIYPVHFIHMGRAMSRNGWWGRLALALIVVGLFTPFF